MAGLGARLFPAFSKLTSAQVNGYLMDQTIMRFASVAARDAAFGGVGEPTLAEGMTCYLDDTNVLQTYNGSAWIEIASSDGKAPRGVMSYLPATGNVSFGGAEVVSITAPTFTAVTNRLYKITYFEPNLPFVQNGNSVFARIRLTNTSGTQLASTTMTNADTNANTRLPTTVTWVGTLTAGSTVIIGTLISPGLFESTSRFTSSPAFIIIEDIGSSL